TGAGFFATELLISPLLTSMGYLLVSLGYASVLIGGRLVLLPRTDPDRDGEEETVMTERRALLAGVVGALAAGGLATFAGREGGLVGSTLPLAAAPSPAPVP